MRKELSEDNILQSEEVGLAHEAGHLFVDQDDIVLGLYDPVHVDVHHYVEAIVHVGAHERKNELEDLRGDVELDLADIDPLKRGHEVHCLRLRQDQLAVEYADAEGLEVDFHEQLHDKLEDATDQRQDFLLAADVSPSRQQLREEQVKLVDLALDLGDLMQQLVVVVVVPDDFSVFLVDASVLDHLDRCVLLGLEDAMLIFLSLELFLLPHRHLLHLFATFFQLLLGGLERRRVFHRDA